MDGSVPRSSWRAGRMGPTPRCLSQRTCSWWIGGCTRAAWPGEPGRGRGSSGGFSQRCGPPRTTHHATAAVPCRSVSLLAADPGHPFSAVQGVSPQVWAGAPQACEAGACLLWAGWRNAPLYGTCTCTYQAGRHVRPVRHHADPFSCAPSLVRCPIWHLYCLACMQDAQVPWPAIQGILDEQVLPAVRQVLEAACSTAAESAGGAPSTGMLVVSMAPAAQPGLPQQPAHAHASVDVAVLYKRVAQPPCGPEHAVQVRGWHTAHAQLQVPGHARCACIHPCMVPWRQHGPGPWTSHHISHSVRCMRRSTQGCGRRIMHQGSWNSTPVAHTGCGTHPCVHCTVQSRMGRATSMHGCPHARGAGGGAGGPAGARARQAQRVGGAAARAGAVQAGQRRRGEVGRMVYVHALQCMHARGGEREMTWDHARRRAWRLDPHDAGKPLPPVVHVCAHPPLCLRCWAMWPTWPHTLK